MKSNKEYIKEDIYSNIESLLNKTSIDNFIDDISENNSSINPIENLTELESPTPGQFNVYMDAMKMNLYLELTAPINMENKISIEVIKKSIDKFGENCEKFVDWDLLNDVFNRVFNEGEFLAPTVIASGIPVEYNIPQYIKLKEDLHVDLTPKESESGSVDFHKINSFIRVKEGEFIGHIVPEYKGTYGENLLGYKISPPTKVISPIIKSVNTVIKGDRIYSSIYGCLKTVGDTLVIDNCLDVCSDVDYQTGDIEFDGDIHITKSVKEGFSVCSKKDTFIDEDVEPSNIISGANLYVQQGIWGSSNHYIKCGGILTSKHINNANIKAIGTVYAQNSIIKSNISTLDKIVLDRRGSLIGGVYHALNCIKTGNVGNETGNETHIHLGVDFEIKEKINILKYSIEEINIEMEKLQKCLHTAETRDEKEKIKHLFVSLKNRLESFTTYSTSLLRKLDRNENSTLTVFGKVYPGTVIDICHVSMKVENLFENIEFSLDKEKGRIKWEYL